MKWLAEKWEANFLVCEFVVCVITTVVFCIWLYKFDGIPILSTILKDNRLTIYSTAASISGSLLGFAITAASIVMGFVNLPQLIVIRKSKHFPKIWKVFAGSIKSLGFTTLATVMGLVFDRGETRYEWIVVVCIFGFLWSIARLIRALWVLEKIMEILTSQELHLM